PLAEGPGRARAKARARAAARTRSPTRRRRRPATRSAARARRAAARAAARPPPSRARPPSPPPARAPACGSRPVSSGRPPAGARRTGAAASPSHDQYYAAPAERLRITAEVVGGGVLPARAGRPRLRNGELLDVLRDQLGHVEHRDLLLAAEHRLEVVVG